MPMKKTRGAMLARNTTLIIRGRRRGVGASKGSQLLEFAFVLPILLILIAGIWDFGSALATKQKLTNADRVGARIVVSNSTNMPGYCATTNAPCCTGTTPCSIEAAANAIFSYMNNANLDASCLSQATPSYSNFVWTWTCQNSSESLSINHAYVTVVNVNGTPVNNLNTQVTLTYPVQWQIANFFGISLLPSKITAQVTMLNLS
jgi:Flp pilus assembly protein TadG